MAGFRMKVMSIPDNFQESITLDIQWLDDCSHRKIDDLEIHKWVSACFYEMGISNVELAVRVVDRCEMLDLNTKYRGRENETNVLSFGNGDIDEFGVRLLGDIVICAPVLSEESLNQGKEQAAHFAHLLVHGILHLLGYDHLQDAEAEEMESIEARILSTLGWSNPYIEKTDDD
tara:strand:- start:200 stop:721 length:522 start_codon:yes stop_codon:yes gene_type:complete